MAQSRIAKNFKGRRVIITVDGSHWNFEVKSLGISTVSGMIANTQD